MIYRFPSDYRSRCNELVLTREEFGDDLYTKLGEAVSLLINAGYECVIRYDEPGLGIILIEYNYDRRKEYGNETAYWISTEEEDVLFSYREEIEEEE